MPRPHEAASKTPIPDFGLYGESTVPPWYDAFYFERISQRGRQHNGEILPHRHNAFVQILYIERGSGETTIEGVRWQLSPGCVLLIPAQAVHSHRFSPDLDGLVVTAAQRPLESMASVARPELVQLLREPTLVHVTPGADDRNAMALLFELLAMESQNSSADHLAAGMSLLLSLVVQIGRLGHAASSRSGAAGDRKVAKIEKFRRLVDQRLRTDHSVDSYAKSVGVTISQLGRLSREVLGMSPLDFINARIVKEAQRDLVYSSLSVKQVAHAVGFNDPAYFSRFFQKQTGLKPTEFREAAHGALLAPA
jgi:AraC family transcriptional activator of pobA